MSKYQEALDYIKMVVPLLKGRIIAYVEEIGLPNSIKTLQELVDIYPEYVELKAKATPKPLVHRFGEVCQSCGRTSITDGGNKDNYCSNCGQKLRETEL